MPTFTFVRFFASLKSRFLPKRVVTPDCAAATRVAASGAAVSETLAPPSLALPLLIESSPMDTPIQMEDTEDRIVPVSLAEEWLTQQGIVLRKKHGVCSEDADLDKIANYWGSHKKYLGRFRKALYRATAENLWVILSLAEASETETEICRTLADKLYACAYATKVQYDNETKTLYIKPGEQSAIKQFLCGGWFERYTKLQIERLLLRMGVEFDILLNAEIILPDQQVYELDIMFIADGKPFWVECKSGDFCEKSWLQSNRAHFNNAMLQLGRKQQHLRIPRRQTMLCLCEIDKDKADYITNSYRLRTISPNYNNVMLAHLMEALA